MLRPADGLEGEAFVLETVGAGPNACPPLVVRVGIGGTFDHVALLANGHLRPIENATRIRFTLVLKNLLKRSINLYWTARIQRANDSAFISCERRADAYRTVACNLNCCDTSSTGGVVMDRNEVRRVTLPLTKEMATSFRMVSAFSSGTDVHASRCRTSTSCRALERGDRLFL